MEIETKIEVNDIKVGDKIRLSTWTTFYEVSEIADNYIIVISDRYPGGAKTYKYPKYVFDLNKELLPWITKQIVKKPSRTVDPDETWRLRRV